MAEPLVVDRNFSKEEESMAHSSLTRRRLLAGAAAALTLAQLPRAGAQAFPSRNMRVVIPTAQGGTRLGLRARTLDLGADVHTLERVVPRYETLPGWRKPITGARRLAGTGTQPG